MKNFETAYPVVGTSALKASPEGGRQARVIAFPGSEATLESQLTVRSLSRFANRPFEGYTKPQLYLAVAIGALLSFIALLV